MTIFIIIKNPSSLDSLKKIAFSKWKGWRGAPSAKQSLFF